MEVGGGGGCREEKEGRGSFGIFSWRRGFSSIEVGGFWIDMID